MKLKEIMESINKTIAYLKREHAMYSWDLFQRLVVKGLVQDGFTKVENPVVDGEWLLVYTKNGEYKEVNLWHLFK